MSGAKLLEGSVPAYHAAGVGALYVHVPFCVRKCFYCDFASWATPRTDPLLGAYAVALEEQIRELQQLGLLGSCSTAYVGGGTPTLLGAALPHLVATINSAAPVDELTCEANPDSLSDELLGELGNAGATRLSIGVQSTSDAELRALGRIHTAAQAEERVRAAVRAGFRTSCDLMCAIPGQTAASWATSLREVESWGVEHVSVYPLAIEEGTVFGRRFAGEDPAWNDPDIQADRMERACSSLQAVGLERYEVASYARPGGRCRHNIAYWTGVPYLGLGTGASGMLTREGYERLRSACTQLPGVGADVARARLTVTSDRASIARHPGLGSLSFDLELLTGPQAVAEDLMLGMRMVDGVSAGLVELARKVLGTAAVNEALSRVQAAGLARWSEAGRFVPTREGWLLGNELYGELWGLAPGKVESVHVP